MAFASINQASVGGGSSNALSIQSDGIFMPRLSTGQRTALALTTSDAGLTVYDFTLNNLFIWNGTAWESIPGSGDAGANGSVQYNDNGIVSGATNFVWDKVNGRVGIGTATPAYLVDVLAAGASTVNDSFNIARLTGANAVANDFSLVGPATSQVRLNFSHPTASGNGEVGYDHATNNLRFVTAGTQKGAFNSTGAFVLAGGEITANGTGVNFPATQAASSNANTLDDYEEGTFLPALATDTVNFTSVGYAIQAGKYTKVGNLVTFAGTIQTSSVVKGLASGAVVITGLPFAQPAVDARGGVNCFAVSAWAVDFPLSGEIITSAIYLLKRATSVSATATLTVADVATGASSNLVRFSGQYYV